MADEELINLLVERTAIHADQNGQSYLQEVAVFISKVFLSETKTIITHDFDPPWDKSGQTCNTEEPFNVHDYTTLDSFTENEFNGTSTPSFVSVWDYFMIFTPVNWMKLLMNGSIYN